MSRNEVRKIDFENIQPEAYTKSEKFAVAFGFMFMEIPAAY
jgi:hypothetical protein